MPQTKREQDVEHPEDLIYHLRRLIVRQDKSPFVPTIRRSLRMHADLSCRTVSLSRLRWANVILPTSPQHSSRPHEGRYYKPLPNINSFRKRRSLGGCLELQVSVEASLTGSDTPRAQVKFIKISSLCTA